MEVKEVKVSRGDVSFSMQSKANKAAGKAILAWVAEMREAAKKKKEVSKK